MQITKIEEPSIKTNRTINEAIDIAATFISSLDASTRGQFAVKQPVANVEVIKSSNARSDADTLIYVVNYEDDNGFVLVTAPTTCKPILGYSDKGNCNIEDGIDDNCPFSFYIDAAKHYVSQTMDSGGVITFPTDPKTFISAIFSRVMVKWGEEYPEGIYCPNQISGCVQTAFAQMMSYLKYPTSINKTFPDNSGNNNIITLDWSELIKHRQSVAYFGELTDEIVASHQNSCNADYEIHETLGLLCRELGYRNGATYNPRSTLVSNLSKARNTFAALMPINCVSEFYTLDNDCDLYNKLDDSNSVIFISGSNQSGDVHAWVCDGGKRVRTTYTVTLVGGYKQLVVNDTYYNSFNWGWHGMYNGLFDAGVFKVDPETSEDYNYQNNVQYFVVTKP